MDPERTRQEISRLITSSGETESARAILTLVYAELRGLAAARLARERNWESLTPTMLVHEAYLRLVGTRTGETLSWNGRKHFFGAAAVAMRRILVERARRRRLRPRNESMATDPASPVPDALGRTGVSLLDLDVALLDFERAHARQYNVVMLRFFAGLGVDDTAAVLGASVPTVKRDWSFARAWLLERIARGRP